MGFSPLLNLDFPQYNTSFTQYLVGHFNISRCSIMLEKLEELTINEEDAIVCID